jgi:translation initiation factor IF-2
VKAAMEGLLEPGIKETSLGKAQVKQIFKVSKVGAIFGCIVTEGKMQRGAKARIIRDNVIVHESSIFTLRRFKDDVREVDKGYECGIVIENYNDIKVGDIIEAYKQEKVARKL